MKFKNRFILLLILLSGLARPLLAQIPWEPEECCPECVYGYSVDGPRPTINYSGSDLVNGRIYQGGGVVRLEWDPEPLWASGTTCSVSTLYYQVDQLLIKPTSSTMFDYEQADGYQGLVRGLISNPIEHDGGFDLVIPEVFNVNIGFYQTPFHFGVLEDVRFYIEKYPDLGWNRVSPTTFETIEIISDPLYWNFDGNDDLPFPDYVIGNGPGYNNTNGVEVEAQESITFALNSSNSTVIPSGYQIKLTARIYSKKITKSLTDPQTGEILGTFVKLGEGEISLTANYDDGTSETIVLEDPNYNNWTWKSGTLVVSKRATSIILTLTNNGSDAITFGGSNSAYFDKIRAEIIPQ